VIVLLSAVGVIVGVVASGKSYSNSDGLILVGISLIGVVVGLRRGKGMRS